MGVGRIFLGYMALVVVLLIPARTSAAAVKTYGTIHHVEFVQIVDADTITVNIRGIHPLVGEQIEVKLPGLAVPSITGRCDREKKLARQAMAIVELLLKKAGKISLQNVGRGKTFQITAVVLADRVDIREVLVQKGLAFWLTDPGPADDWCRGKGN